MLGYRDGLALLDLGTKQSRVLFRSENSRAHSRQRR
jgi:hypothetical protein